MTDGPVRPGSSDLPADPVTALAIPALSLHEVFTSYIAAGFTHDQALYLTGIVLYEGLRTTRGL